MDIPEIVEVLDVELRADPYGTAIAVIREVLSFVLDEEVNGSMSQGELRILDSIARHMASLDPAAAIEREV